MIKKFKFTDKAIKGLPANDRESKSTDLEVSDTLVQGLKCSSSKKENSKRFLFRFSFNGRKQSISLGRFGDINVAQARQLAQKHRVTLGEGLNPKAERDCSDRLTLNAFFTEHYLPSIKKRKKSWRDDQYRYDIMIAPLGHILYRDLRTIDIQQFHLGLTEQVNKHGRLYAPASCNQALMILKSMTKYALNLGVIDEDVSLPVKLFRLNNARTRFLDVEEVKGLLKACREYSNKTIAGYIALLALTGLRCSEVSNIKIKEVDTSNRLIQIPITKNGKPRSIYLTDPMLAFIGRVPVKKGNPYLFAGKAEGKPLGSVRKTFKTLLKRAGIDSDDVCLHTLRHSVASNLVSAGVSLRLVQEQLQHKSIISTQRYAKLTTESMRQTSETLSNLLT